MRNALLLLLLVVAAATWVFARMGGGGVEVQPEPELQPRGGAPIVEEVAEDRDRNANTLAQPTPKAPPVAPKAQRTVDGTVLDRFGHAVANERVYLLRADQGHPTHGADLSFYVTALTSRAGEFSIRVPDEGPWRMSVGQRGAPRTNPSELRTVREATKAEITVPGAAAIRVLLDGVPKDGENLSVELLSLSQPTNMETIRSGGGTRTGTRGGTGVEERSDRRNRRGGARGGGDATGVDDRGAFRSVDDEGRDLLAREDLEIDHSVAASYQGRGNRNARSQEREQGEESEAAGQDEEKKQERSGGRNRETRQGQGKQGQGRKERPEKVDVPATPPERWVSLRRHLVSKEELDTGVAEFSGLPGGSIARLGLRVGRERVEGQQRFTLVDDAVTVVRVLNVKTGPGASLTYTSSLEMLRADERPLGIRWVD